MKEKTLVAATRGSDYSGIWKGSVFLSHSGEDLDEAVDLKRLLEKEGFECRIAEWDLPRHTTFPRAIAAAISESSQFLAMASEHASRSEWVESECLYAIEEGKPIHVVRMDDSRLPLYLIARHYIDLYGRGRTGGLQQLVYDLKRSVRS